MRIGYLSVRQETNDFNPRLTTLDDYRSYGILRGAELSALAHSGHYGGYTKSIEASGQKIEPVPILHAGAVAGGRISREAFEFFNEEIRSGLGAAGPLDGLVFLPHGACASEGVDDVEGEQIALCRALVGPDVPIALGLDHHANVTHKMIANADLVVGHRTQPHDPFDTGEITTRLLIRVISEGIHPTVAWRKIPMLSHQEQFFTDRPPMKIWFDRARAIEAEYAEVLQASNYPMQPWLDLAEGGWSTVVCTNDNQDLAERLADELADLAWSLRDAFQERIAVSADEAVLAADAAAHGVVVLSDTGDTVFGGAAGDSNILLEAMLRLDIKGPALVPMIAPEAVRHLHAAGEGARVTLSLGGQTAPDFFAPLEVTGTVRRLGAGKVRTERKWRSGVADMGLMAIFDVGPVTILLTELRGAGGNLPEVYEALGVNPADYKMAVMKTATAFHHFDPYRSEVIRVDTRGPAQSDIMGLPWKRIPRPIYPLDPVADWRRPKG